MRIARIDPLYSSSRPAWRDVAMKKFAIYLIPGIGLIASILGIASYFDSEKETEIRRQIYTERFFNEYFDYGLVEDVMARIKMALECKFWSANAPELQNSVEAWNKYFGSSSTKKDILSVCREVHSSLQQKWRESYGRIFHCIDEEKCSKSEVKTKICYDSRYSMPGMMMDVKKLLFEETPSQSVMYGSLFDLKRTEFKWPKGIQRVYGLCLLNH